MDMRKNGSVIIEGKYRRVYGIVKNEKVENKKKKKDNEG
jgi:hypothetical protein